MALIELKDVARHYQLGEIDVPALDGVSLSIEAGEFVAIMRCWAKTAPERAR